MRLLYLVSGFSRGGTNILWNLVCSHPGVLSTGFELNEILGPTATDISYFQKGIIESFVIPGIKPPKRICQFVKDRIVLTAEENAKKSWGRMKSSTTFYSDSEIRSLPVCTKAVNSWSRDWLFTLLKRNLALKYTPLLRATGTRLLTLYLIRDAEAQCNGWMRRGCTAIEAGRWYRNIVECMLNDYEQRPNEVMFVRFENVLNDPLGTVERTYQFLELQPLQMDEFHLKSKKMLRNDGSHDVVRGFEGEMMWVSRSDIPGFIDSGVDARQRKHLSVSDRSKLFEMLGDISKRLECVMG